MARQSALSIYLSVPEIRPGLVVAGRVLWYLARPARALMRLRQSGRFWARSSAVEHYLDMVGVTGSIPVVPTKILKALTGGGRASSIAGWGFFLRALGQMSIGRLLTEERFVAATRHGTVRFL